MAWSASSDWERWDPKQYVICPYDRTHRIYASRFQKHLVKCRMNHPDKDFVSCPFNASHQILRPHLRSHICSCPDKNVVEPDYNGFGKDDESYYLKGDTSVPSYYSSNVDETDEDWDEEIMENKPQSEPCTEFEYMGPFQHRSILQTTEEFKREMKQRALTDDVNRRWSPTAKTGSSMHSGREGARSKDIMFNRMSRAENFGNTEHFVDNRGSLSADQVAPEKTVLRWEHSKTCRQEDKSKEIFNPLYFVGRGRGKLIQNAYEKHFGENKTKNMFR